MMELKKIIESASKKLSAKLEFGDTKPDAHILCPAENLVDFFKWLKSKEGGDYVSLMCVSGVDYKEHMESVYHVYSFSRKHMLTVKVKIANRADAHCPSLCGVYKAANYWERETYDLLGITYDNHPDLRRILCPDDWEGHPLRKDYKPQEFYQGIPMTFGAPTVDS